MKRVTAKTPVADLPVAQPAPEAGSAPEKSKNGKKTECPITRKQFADGAKPVLVSINDRPSLASPREFSTGSLGWFINEKTVISVGGEMVSVQAQVTLTVIGSKELPKDQA